MKLTTVHQNQTESIILSFNSAGYHQIHKQQTKNYEANKRQDITSNQIKPGFEHELEPKQSKETRSQNNNE